MESNKTKAPSLPADLEHQRFQWEIERHRQEIELRKEELAWKISEAQRSTWTSPLTLSLLAAVVGLFGNAGVTVLQGLNNSSIKEREYEANVKLEREKLRSNLVIESIKTGNTSDAAKNLQFLAKIGIIEDSDGSISRYLETPTNVPVLPTPVAWSDSSEAFLMNFRNGCDVPTRILVHSFGHEGTWITSGWYNLNPQESTSTVSSKNPNIYYYAESKDGRTWAGDLSVEYEGKVYKFARSSRSSIKDGPFIRRFEQNLACN